jgi:hypothetical protein
MPLQAARLTLRGVFLAGNGQHSMLVYVLLAAA